MALVYFLFTFTGTFSFYFGFNIQELHELFLKTHQELIIAKLGKEAAEEIANKLQLDIKSQKDRITHEQNERKAIEEHLDAEIKVLK